MALVLEDGSGVATAEAYESVTNFAIYWSLRGVTSIPGSTANHEEALRIGTQYLDAVYGRRYRGRRKSRTQALHWPRELVWDDQDLEITSATIPVELKSALNEVAYRQRTGTVLLPDVAVTDGGVLLKRIRVGDIETERRYGGGAGLGPLMRLVDAILKPIILPDGLLRA